MDDALLDLAREVIDMRKRPLQTRAHQRYPAAAQQLTAAVTACDSSVTLRALIRLDTGHVLPPPVMQVAYETLLSDEAQRTPDVLRAYALHLTMFGYTDSAGNLVHDTDALTQALFDEAEGKASG
jgi:hypothetical protein